MDPQSVSRRGTQYLLLELLRFATKHVHRSNKHSCFQIRDFTLQVIQNPLVFTACGFITIDRSFLQSVTRLPNFMTALVTFPFIDRSILFLGGEDNHHVPCDRDSNGRSSKGQICSYDEQCVDSYNHLTILYAFAYYVRSIIFTHFVFLINAQTLIL